jgi:hypothetical protein
MGQLELREPQGQKEALGLLESEPQAQQEFKVQLDLLGNHLLFTITKLTQL